jgi:hypothetical protein
MRVYHFVDRKYGLQNLRQRELKIAIFNELNDPFELLGIASKDREDRRAYLDFKNDLAKKIGLLCFSGHWTNPVQWSHYADRHRGLCLGFDVINELVPVTYTRRRLKLDLIAIRAGGLTAHRYMLQVLATKFSHWRYENEHRLFVRLKEKDKKGLYFVGFCKQLALREVIVGHNSTISRAELTRALGDMACDVKVYKARLAFRTFRVVRQRSGERWK